MPAVSQQSHERTCIGCGVKASKQALCRIVRNADGTASLDAKGNIAGRGAYVCSPECLVKAGSGRLGRALKATVSEANMAEITESLNTYVAANKQAIGV